MSIPTITGVEPPRGATGGYGLVEIHGTGFRLPPEPVLRAGETPAPPPSVRVFLGGVEARNVRVVSAERLLVVTAAHRAGVVDVEVRNVGEYGETIEQELVVLPGGFTYVMPDLTRDTTITLVVRSLMDELMNQVFPNVVHTQGVDWTDEPESALRRIATAQTPCVLVEGPQLRENLLYRTSAPTIEQLPGETLREYRIPRVVDLLFTLGAIADNPVLLQGLAHALTNFVQRSQWIHVGGAPYEVAFEPNGDMAMANDPGNNDLSYCTGSISVRAVPLSGLHIEGDMATDLHPPLLHPPRVSTTRRE